MLKHVLVIIVFIASCYNPTAYFCCCRCGVSFCEESSFRIHLKFSSACAMAHPQTFTCLEYNQCFIELECFQQDIRKHGNIVQGKQCFYCGTTFSRIGYRGNLQMHIRIHTEGNPYKCIYCGKCFKQINIL